MKKEHWFYLLNPDHNCILDVVKANTLDDALECFKKEHHDWSDELVVAMGVAEHTPPEHGPNFSRTL